jgi:hypothetical protein
MGNRNTHKLEITADKLMKLACTSNREDAVEQGAYDGRFSSRIEPDQKRTKHLKLRRNKPLIRI